MNEFVANTQYGDLVGTVSADRLDGKFLGERLKELNLIRKDENIVGVRVCFQELTNPKPKIVVYVHEAKGFVERPNVVLY